MARFSFTRLHFLLSGWRWTTWLCRPKRTEGRTRSSRTTRGTRTCRSTWTVCKLASSITFILEDYRNIAKLFQWIFKTYHNFALFFRVRTGNQVLVVSKVW